jgi:nitrous oxide reductase accessory protein NosL
VIDIVLNTHRTIRDISVADYNTHEQIQAEKAFWVIGGDRLGVMTARAKWAFSTKAAAEDFIHRHGGRSASFEAVIQAAFEDMYQDTMMIQKKRRMMNSRKSDLQ